MMKSGIYQQLAPIKFGPGMVTETGAIAKSFGMTKAFLVTDQGVVGAGHHKKVIASLEAAGIECVVFDNCAPECPSGAIRETVLVARENGIDGVIGLGGGTALDTAKIVAQLVPNDMEDVLAHMKDYLFQKKFQKNPQLAVICIPTTFGTGSESTYCAMINSEADDAKLALRTNPSYGILDPELAFGLPPVPTAFTGLDAFSHALEALTGLNRTPMSDVLAYEAISRIVKWLPVCYKDGYNLEARSHMALAANFAGISFTEANTHIGHCAAHLIGHDYHVPHGHACALTIPCVIELMAKDFPEKTYKLAQAMGVDVKENDPEMGNIVAAAARKLLKELNIPTLADCGLSREDAMKYAKLIDDNFLAHKGSLEVNLEVCEKYMASMFDNYK